MTVSIDSTMIERPTAYANTPAGAYKVCKAIVPAVATAGGGGAGSAVTTSFAFSDPDFQPADTNYSIFATASQACAVSFSSKATTGFNVVLTPLNSGVTLSAGTIDVEVVWTA